MKDVTLKFTEPNGSTHICTKKGIHKFVPFKGGLLHENIRKAVKVVTGDSSIKADSVISPCPMSNMEIYILITENAYYFVRVHDNCVIEVVLDEDSNGGFAIRKRLVAHQEGDVTFFYYKDKVTGQRDGEYYFIAW